MGERVYTIFGAADYCGALQDAPEYMRRICTASFQNPLVFAQLILREQSSPVELELYQVTPNEAKCMSLKEGNQTQRIRLTMCASEDAPANDTERNSTKGTAFLEHDEAKQNIQQMRHDAEAACLFAGHVVD